MPNKLIPKTNEDGTPTSISQVSKMLRQKVEPQEEIKTGQVPEEQVNEKPEQKADKQQQTPMGTKLENMLFEIKQQRGQEIQRQPIVVDMEVYEVFAMLKAKKRVPAAGLVSQICRQWIIQNKAELEIMLGQKINVQ